MKKNHYDCLLCLLVIMSMKTIKANLNYTEHHVKLGDPWNVTCYTPLKEPTSWVFISALLNYFNDYIFIHGQFDKRVDRRYNLTTLCDQQKQTLNVLQTDQLHAGYYGCFPDAHTLKDRQYFKLILIGDSTVKLSKYDNNNITLTMKISFLGHKTPAPVFECSFHYGTNVMSKTKCDLTRERFSTCTLEKLYLPDDVLPDRCKIYFNNVNHKIWMDKHLELILDNRIDYVEKGRSWNMSCKSPSDHPIKWRFCGIPSNHTNNTTAHEHWISNDNKKYILSVQNITYTLTLPHPDVNDAGTYKCTYHSRPNVIERKIQLAVIVNSEIAFYQHNNPNTTNQSTIVMFVSYVSPNNTIKPNFKCTSNKEIIIMDTTPQCNYNKLDNIEKCHLVEVLYTNQLAVEKCQIWFNNYLHLESKFSKGAHVLKESLTAECTDMPSNCMRFTVPLGIMVAQLLSYISILYFVLYIL